MTIREDIVSIVNNWKDMPNLAEPEIKSGYNNRKPLPRNFAIPMSGKNSDWCAVMVSEALSRAYEHAGYVNPYREVSAQKLFEQLSKDFGVVRLPDYLLPGDPVVFDWDGNGNIDHIGFVTNVTDTEITSVEGNVNDRMHRRTFKIGEKVNGCYPQFIPMTYPDTETPETELQQIVKEMRALLERLEKSFN